MICLCLEIVIKADDFRNARLLLLLHDPVYIRKDRRIDLLHQAVEPDADGIADCDLIFQIDLVCHDHIYTF